MSVATWNSGPRVQVRVRRVDALQVGHHQRLDEHGLVAQQRAVGRAEERRGVEHEHRVGRVDVQMPGRRARPVAGTPRSRRGRRASASWRSQRPPTAAPAAAGGAHRVAHLGLLPDHDLGAGVVEHEGQLVGALAPVDDAEHRADLGRRGQALEDAVAVLAQSRAPRRRGRRPLASSAVASRLTRSSCSGQVRRTSPSTTAGRPG